MEKNSRDHFLNKIQQYNRNIPKTIFQTKQQEYLIKHETFGISTNNISGQFTLVANDQVLFYCSNMLVIKSIDKNISRYLYKEGRLKSLTAICCAHKQSQDKQLIIAAGEQAYETNNQKSSITIITVYDKREDWKVIQTQHKGKIEHLQFNRNKTKLGCLSISSDQIFFSIYNVQKSSIIINSNFKSNDIKKFTMDMNSQKLVYFYGDGLLKFYQINPTEKTLKDLGTSLLNKQNKQTKFIDHIWLPGNTNKQPYSLVVISSSKIFIIKNEAVLKTIFVDIEKTKIKSWNELKLQYTKDPQQENEVIDPHQIRLTEKFELKCLLKQEKEKKGSDYCLIIGASNGLIIFYDMTTAEINAYQIFWNQEMVSLTSNLNRTILASVSRDYYEKKLSFNLIRPQMLDTDDAPFECFFGEGYHFNNILSLSVAAGRELFVTGSLDKSIRVWNYLTKQSISFGSYKQIPVSIAMHPSGFWIAVAFSTQIEIYSILSNSLYLLKSVRNLDNVKSIKFSNKGHFLIANQTSSLKLYDPFSLRVISLYEMDDGRIPLLSYAIDHSDSRLVGIYENGNLLTWQIVEGDNELPSKTSHIEPLGYQHMVIDENYFVGTNRCKYLSIYKNNCQTLINEFPIIDCTVTSLLLSKQLSILFVGTSSGTIRLYSWPITELSCHYQLVENSSNKVRLMLPTCYQSIIHNSNITALGLSQDCKFLFSGLDNGGIIMLQLKGLKTQQQRNQKNKQLFIQLKQQRKKIKQATTNIFLICDSKMQDKNDHLKRMQLQLQKMQQRIQKQKIGRQKHLKRLISEKLQQYSNIIVKDKQAQDKTLFEQKVEISKLEQEYLETKNLFEIKTTSNNGTYEKSHEYQIQRREKLKQEIGDLKQQYIKKLDRLLAKHKIKLNEIKDHYKEVGKGLEQEYKQTLNQAELKFSLKYIHQKQNDVELVNNEDKIKHLNKVIQQLKQKHAEMEQKNAQSLIQDERVQTEFSQMFDAHNQCRLKNIKLRQQILKTEHQLNERISIVRNREQTYKDANQCQLALQNYKSVIDNRILQLQRKKKDIYEKTQQKQNQLQILFNELISSTEINEKKKFDIKKQESYKQNLQQNARRSEIQIFFGIKRLKSYQQFIEDILNSKQTKSKLHAKISHFLENPLPEDLQMVGYLQKTSIGHKDVQQIYKLKQQKGNQQNNKLQNEGKILTKKFNLMKFTCKKMKDTHQTNITYTLRQNQKLIQQCNLLRYQNQCYEKQISKAQKFVHLTMQEQKKVSSNVKRTSQKFKEVQKKLFANEQLLKQQAFQLSQIRQFISTIKKQKQS